MAEYAPVSPRLNGPAEVVLVNARSPDGTAELAGELGRGKGLNVRVVTRNGPRSLGGGIAHGLDACRRDLVGVMDADFFHPPGLLPLLLESLGGAGGVVSPRCVPGAAIRRVAFLRD